MIIAIAMIRLVLNYIINIYNIMCMKKKIAEIGFVIKMPSRSQVALLKIIR